MKIYLAGPIFQSTDEEAKDWREYVKEYLTQDKCFDPMDRDYRGKEDESVEDIVRGDKDDIMFSDVVLANVSKPSSGTAMEIYFAWDWNIPVIAVVKGRVSPWIRYHSTYVVETVEEALEKIEEFRK